jgi:hypothetical protein
MVVDNDQLLRAVEVINGAIMSEEPVLIVEGSTDITVYRRIALKTSKRFSVKPVELVRGYGEGCSEVMRLVSDLEASEVSAANISGNLIGVIDRDVREYRRELPTSENVVVLKYYSIESHFVFSNAIIPCLRISIPNVRQELIPVLRDLLFSRFAESVHTLRLASLDALRGSLDPTYSSDFKYSDGFGRLKDQVLLTKLDGKRTGLITFLGQIGLDESLISMKMFVKGKVLLDALTSTIASSLRDLHNDCGCGTVLQCGYCAAGKAQKCELRTSALLNEKALKAVIISEFPEDELSYLVDLLDQKIQ